MKYLENIKAQMKKGILELMILQIIKRKKVYAAEILNGLKKTNLLVVEGTLYPVLSRLRKWELVSYSWKESKSGPPRKYYILTKKGSLALVELEKAWEANTKSIQSLIDKK